MSLNALTVDLEDYFHVSNFDDVIERSAWDAQPLRVARSTRLLLDLFEARGARATFFVLGWVAKRCPELIGEIRDRGHEIACHGFGHELVYDMRTEEFRDDLRRACDAIESASGVRPRGYRAPSYSITRRSLWALDVLAEEGFRFDSSIFPITHHRYGIPEFPRHPQRLELAGGRRLDEFPLTTLRLGGLNWPMAGGAYLRFMPGPVFRWGFGRIAASGPSVLYVHPWEVDADQPRQSVGWKVRVNHYHGIERTLGRLENLLSGHSFSPMGEVLERLDALGRLPTHRLAELDRAA